MDRAIVSRAQPDPLLVGRVLGNRSIVLDDARLRAYLDGIGAHDNSWYSVQSPYGTPIFPPGTLFYEAMEFPGPRDHEKGRAAFNSGIGWEGRAPLRQKSTLGLTARVSDRWLKRCREFAVFEVAVAEEDRSMGVARFKESWDRPPFYDPPLAGRDHEPAAMRPDKTGPEIGELSRLFSFEMCCAYAGEARNIHTDRSMAAARGFSDVLVAGPQLACLASELLTRVFGRGYLEGGAFEINLLQPVLAGERITASVCWLRASPTYDAGGRGEFYLAAENDAGRKVLGGIARIPVWDQRT